MFIVIGSSNVIVNSRAFLSEGPPREIGQPLPTLSYNPRFEFLTLLTSEVILENL